MARDGFRLNSGQMKAFLQGPEVRKVIGQVGERVAARARATAPVDTGAYKASITVVQDTTDRAAARVVARDKKAILVEMKTGNLKRAMGGA